MHTREIVGVVDRLGYIRCSRCARPEHGGNPVYAGATHSDELCEACATILVLTCSHPSRFWDGYCPDCHTATKRRM